GARISSHADILARALKAGGVKPVPPRVVSGYEAFLAMIASGSGVSLLQKNPSIRAISGLTTRPLKESGPELVVEARAIWQPRESPLVNNFVDVIRTRNRGRTTAAVS
ncbi:MAG TPA: LysR substrate-binding domain-containing protein, partial [Opitutaceae bacterium]|nr:LysR substrate-binding domain-containing protein [Opitutaceae bacterium]